MSELVAPPHWTIANSRNTVPEPSSVQSLPLVELWNEVRPNFWRRASSQPGNAKAIPRQALGSRSGILQASDVTVRLAGPIHQFSSDEDCAIFLQAQRVNRLISNGQEVCIKEPSAFNRPSPILGRPPRFVKVPPTIIFPSACTAIERTAELAFGLKLVSRVA